MQTVRLHAANKVSIQIRFKMFFAVFGATPHETAREGGCTAGLRGYGETTILFIARETLCIQLRAFHSEFIGLESFYATLWPLPRLLLCHSVTNY